MSGINLTEGENPLPPSPTDPDELTSLGFLRRVYNWTQFNRSEYSVYEEITLNYSNPLLQYNALFAFAGALALAAFLILLWPYLKSKQKWLLKTVPPYFFSVEKILACVATLTSICIWGVMVNTVENAYAADPEADPREYSYVFYEPIIVWTELMFSILFSVHSLIAFATSTGLISFFFVRGQFLVLLTIPPGIFGPIFDYYYFGFTYFRAMIVLDSLSELAELTEVKFPGHLNPPKFYRKLVYFIVEMLTIMASFVLFVGSFMFVFENTFWFGGKFVQWVDCFYFSIITLATVGYGDYFPVTPIGQIFIGILILAGIICIPLLIDKLVRVVRDIKETQRCSLRGHVVLYTKDWPAASFVQTYFHALSYSTPPLLILGSDHKLMKELQAIPTLHQMKKLHCLQFWDGDLKGRSTVKRVHAQCASSVVILRSRTLSATENAADSYLSVLNLLQQSPDAKLKIYVQLHHTGHVAPFLSLPQVSVLATNHLAEKFFNLSLAAPGIISFLINILTPSSPMASDGVLAAWEKEYHTLADVSMVQNVDIDQFAGFTFWEAAVALFRQYGVLLIGYTTKPRLVLSQKRRFATQSSKPKFADSNPGDEPYFFPWDYKIEKADKGILVCSNAISSKLKKIKFRPDHHPTEEMPPPKNLKIFGDDPPSRPTGSMPGGKHELKLSSGGKDIPKLAAASSIGGADRDNFREGKIMSAQGPLEPEYLVKNRVRDHIIVCCNQLEEPTSLLRNNTRPVVFISPHCILDADKVQKILHENNAFLISGSATNVEFLKMANYSKAYAIFIKNDASSEDEDSISVLIYSMCSHLDEKTRPFIVVGLNGIHTIKLIGGRDSSLIPGGHIFWADIFNVLIMSLADQHSSFTPSVKTINGLLNCSFLTLPVPALAALDLDKKAKQLPTIKAVQMPEWEELFFALIPEKAIAVGILRLVPGQRYSRYFMVNPPKKTRLLEDDKVIIARSVKGRPQHLAFSMKRPGH